MAEHETRKRILEIATQILASGGLAAVSFDAIARRLGMTKQAVLYWFSTKQNLLAAMFLPWLEAEVDAAEAALAPTSGHQEAIEAFVRGLAGFHLADPDRFRMMYLLPQTLGTGGREPREKAILEQVHPLTARLYDALAAKLREGGSLTDEDARRRAVAIHSATLGLVMMVTLSDSLDDPLRHATPDLIDALAATLR